MATKNKLLTVLSDAEQFALYGLPDFDEEQRLEFLSLSEAQLGVWAYTPWMSCSRTKRSWSITWQALPSPSGQSCRRDELHRHRGSYRARMVPGRDRRRPRAAPLLEWPGGSKSSHIRHWQESTQTLGMRDRADAVIRFRPTALRRLTRAMRLHSCSVAFPLGQTRTQVTGPGNDHRPSESAFGNDPEGARAHRIGGELRVITRKQQASIYNRGCHAFDILVKDERRLVGFTYRTTLIFTDTDTVI
jgi:hypothetical protein